MEVKLYCQSYDISSSWGSWFGSGAKMFFV